MSGTGTQLGNQTESPVLTFLPFTLDKLKLVINDIKSGDLNSDNFTKYFTFAGLDDSQISEILVFINSRNSEISLTSMNKFLYCVSCFLFSETLKSEVRLTHPNCPIPEVFCWDAERLADIRDSIDALTFNAW